MLLQPAPTVGLHGFSAPDSNGSGKVSDRPKDGPRQPLPPLCRPSAPQTKRGRGRPRLGPDVEHNVRAEFARTGDKTETARNLGMHRSQVRRILAGNEAQQLDSTLSPKEHRVEPHRCPMCRQLITVVPCRICASRARAALAKFRRLYKREPVTEPRGRSRPRKPVWRDPRADDAPLQLELFGEEQQRLREVIDRRQQAGGSGITLTPDS